MKRWFFLALALLAAWPAAAQYTQVTGTVVDTNGIPYAGAQVKAQLVFSGTPSSNPTVTVNNLATCRANGFGSAPCNIPYQPNQGPFFLDSGGNFPGGGITLADVTQVLPAASGWTFTVSEQGTPPPLGTGPQVCTATIAISGASQSVSSSFNGCPSLSQISTGSGASAAYSILLAQNCPGTSTPCVQLPAPGNCFGGVVTNGTSTLTFNSGFPANIQVGMEAWVMTSHSGCLEFAIYSQISGWAETNYCGSPSTSSPPITVTAVNSGLGTVTLSSNANCNTQGGTNSYLFYGFNIFNQIASACAQGAPTLPSGVLPILRFGPGWWIIDNVKSSVTGAPACGTNSLGSNGAATGLVGAGEPQTIFLTPPWYNHSGDTGTVFALGNGGDVYLSDFTLSGTWTNLNLPHFTDFEVAGCPHGYDFTIEGYYGGTNSAIEGLYGAIGGHADCSFHNVRIATGNRGLEFGSASGVAPLIDHTWLYTGSTSLINVSNGAFSQNLTITDSVINCQGVAEPTQANGSCIDYDNTGASGDIYKISNSDIQLFSSSAAGQAAIRVPTGSSAEFRIVNSRIGTNGSSSNSSGIILTSGSTLRASNATINATGTGNTINNAGTYYDGCGNTISGGAGYAGAGSVFGNCSVIGTAPVTGNFVLTNASFASVSGSDQKHFTLNVTATAAAAITIAYTFPTPFLVAPGSCRAQQIGGINPILTFSTSSGPSTTTVTFLSTAAATNTDTLAVAIDCN